MQLHRTVDFGDMVQSMYTKAFGAIDATINYQITDKLQATLEGLNLSKAHIRNFGRDKTRIYFAQEPDSRYQLGLRYKF